MKTNKKLIQYLVNCLMDGTLIDQNKEYYCEPKFSENADRNAYWANCDSILQPCRPFSTEMKEAIELYRNLPLISALRECKKDIAINTDE